MDKDKLGAQLLATFCEELKEHVSTIERELLALEKASGAARAGPLAALSRVAHTLKGAALSVGSAPVAECCHRLEDVLASLREGRRIEDAALFALLYSAADSLREAGDLLSAGPSIPLGRLSALSDRLRSWLAAEGGGRPTERPSPVPASPPPESAAATSAASSVVRVPVTKLDRLQDQSGELLIARRRIEGRVEDLSAVAASFAAWRAEWTRAEKTALKELAGAGRSGAWLTTVGVRLASACAELERVSGGMAADSRALAQAAAPLEESARAARMLPFLHAVEGLERAARDSARATGKEVELVVTGGDVAIDRAVLDALRPALLHLVRNAVDHGIEAPERRLSAGKPARGRVEVAASLRGSRVEICVEDDGQGIDGDAVRERARREGLPVPQNDAELAELVFRAGFTTARAVSDVSGRGIGLDAVRGSAQALRGWVEFDSEPGKGSRVRLSAPLTLTTLRALLLSAGGHIFACALASVRGVSRVAPSGLRAVEGRETVTWEGAPVPVIPLTRALDIPFRGASATGGRALLMVLRVGRQQTAFAVDELLGEQEVVVKPLGARISRAPCATGAAVLPTGRIALILDAPSLLARAQALPAGPALSEALAAPAAAARRRVLVVEDSVTTRSLVKSVLEAAGYDVIAAADGAQGWRLLQEQPFDVLVSDIEMPGMDGLGLTQAVRGSKRLRDLPVVLVTALERDEEKARGLESGADAYIKKSGFDQALLLETISRLL